MSYGYHWKYYQPNEKDKKNKANDCVIRALCAVTDHTWTDVFKELCEIAIKKQTMPNDKRAYEQFLRNNGFEYTGIKIDKGMIRPTVERFAFDHETGSESYYNYVLVCANHLVACIDGQYLDTWDSGDKSVYSYWKKAKVTEEDY